MKQFNVENAFKNAEQIAGNEPYDPFFTDNYLNDNVEADTKEEAIKIAIDAIVESIRQNSEYTDIRVEDETITVYDDEGNAVEEYYNFSAKQVERTMYCVEHSENDAENAYYENKEEAITAARELQDCIETEGGCEEIWVTKGIEDEDGYASIEMILDVDGKEV